ncbi:hypothetical protein AM1BK_29830 [Neobacillus kokaensis]|uniref:Uncharacterized protein n=1 Tax=Neobacillus kokaensis TaxID=2759023 RepID=A0ABQ3N3B0_9BACI|nr:hypothetical protein AM1BK_29830 [Neobacillus kokaensis]
MYLKYYKFITKGISLSIELIVVLFIAFFEVFFSKFYSTIGRVSATRNVPLFMNWPIVEERIQLILKCKL